MPKFKMFSKGSKPAKKKVVKKAAKKEVKKEAKKEVKKAADVTCLTCRRMNRIPVVEGEVCITCRQGNRKQEIVNI